MNLKTLSDNELVALAQQKNQIAVEELMERYKYVPASVARSYFLIGGAKEDLLQEGMIGVYRAISSFDNSKAEFKTYVYSCVKNSIISSIKKSKTKDEHKAAISTQSYLLRNKIDMTAWICAVLRGKTAHINVRS